MICFWSQYHLARSRRYHKTSQYILASSAFTKFCFTFRLTFYKLHNEGTLMKLIENDACYDGDSFAFELLPVIVHHSFPCFDTCPKHKPYTWVSRPFDTRPTFSSVIFDWILPKSKTQNSIKSCIFHTFW